MASTIVRTYADFSNAQHARNALLSVGFSLENVNLYAREDEAGPVEGNFILDEKDTGKGPPGSGFFSKLFRIEERTDAYNNAEPKWGVNYMLIVNANDGEQLAYASDIMDRFGAIDVDARTSNTQPK